MTAADASAGLPEHIENEAQLDDVLTTPTPALAASLARQGGDVLILGVAGKMGPTLARLARRALDQAGSTARVIGVARFSQPERRRQLEEVGVETLTADLLEPGALAALPDAPNVIYLAGRKFGSTGQEELTWAMNTYLPGLVADRYRASRIVALSTGNVYPLTPVDRRGPTEDQTPDPLGEYAQSCLGRERMFQYSSVRWRTPVAIIRLNYAIDLRYGVLVDVGRKVYHGEPIDLAMGHVNVIWQGDANAAVLRSLEHCSTPPFILNLTGPEVLSIRAVAVQFGRLFGKEPVFCGNEAPTALLSDASRYVRLMGPPRVSTQRLIAWAAHWIHLGGRSLGKPTHYEARDGKF